MVRKPCSSGLGAFGAPEIDGANPAVSSETASVAGYGVAVISDAVSCPDRVLADGLLRRRPRFGAAHLSGQRAGRISSTDRETLHPPVPESPSSDRGRAGRVAARNSSSNCTRLPGIVAPSRAPDGAACSSFYLSLAEVQCRTKKDGIDGAVCLDLSLCPTREA